MIDFKELSHVIFDICTNISKADGRATEKIEEILKKVYEEGKERDNLVTNRKTKKALLVTLLQQSGVPASNLNTVKMKFEPVNLEKIADFLLSNGVEITDPVSDHLYKTIIKATANNDNTKEWEGLVSKVKWIMTRSK